MRLELTFIVSASIIMSSFAAASAQSSAPGPDDAIQSEAELELTEIDCSVMALSADVERIEQDMYRHFKIIDEKVAASTKATDALTKSGEDLRKRALVDPIKEMLSEVDKIKGGTFEDYVNRYARTGMPIKILRLSGRLNAMGTIFQDAHLFSEALSASTDAKRTQRELLRAMADMDDSQAQLNAANGALQTLMRSRVTAVNIWTEAGADLDGKFMGDACQEDKGFEGRWQITSEPEGSDIEIKANSFHIVLRSSIGSGVGEPVEGAITFAGPDEIRGKWRGPCIGLTNIGEFSMKRDGSTYSFGYCMSASYAGDPPRGCDSLNYRKLSRQ